jgi:DNA-binding CsgD family transcriptional regulator
MRDSLTHDWLDELTEKQVVVLDLVAHGFTSKEIARQLDLAPRTVDQRVDAVRNRLGGISRADVVRRYRSARSICDPTTYDGITIADTSPYGASESRQLENDVLLFEDSLTFDARVPWQRESYRLPPGFSPSDLGTGGKLLFILAGAALIMMVAVLSVAFSNGLQTMFGG